MRLALKTGEGLCGWAALSRLPGIEVGELTELLLPNSRRWIAALADAPVARSGDALVATLPQWPRMNANTACSMY